MISKLIWSAFGWRFVEHHQLKAPCDNDAAVEPSALKAKSPASDLDTFNRQAERLGLAGLREHECFGPRVPLYVMRLLADPFDDFAFQARWKLEAELFRIPSDVLTWF